MPPPSHRPTYTPAQITSYYTHISLPPTTAALPSTSIHHDPQTALNFLTQLQKHQITTVPFENLSLHYSPHHSISLDPAALFEKIVEHGRGGYCMENNCFFGTVLRTLGFTIYSAGARVNQLGASGKEREEYHSWLVHCSLVV